MNFSHGEYEYHQSVIDNTRKMVSRTFFKLFNCVTVSHRPTVDPEGRPVAIALDTVCERLSLMTFAITQSSNRKGQRSGPV